MVVELDHDGCTVTVVSGNPVPIHTQPGVTGLSPEPEGEPDDFVAPESAAPPERPDLAEHVDPTDHADRVVLVAPGQSIRIDSNPTVEIDVGALEVPTL
jgi:hypothetical protein